MTKQQKQRQDVTNFVNWLHAQQTPEQVELEKKLFKGKFAKPSNQTLGESMSILASGEK